MVRPPSYIQQPVSIYDQLPNINARALGGGVDVCINGTNVKNLDKFICPDTIGISVKVFEFSICADTIGISVKVFEFSICADCANAATGSANINKNKNILFMADSLFHRSNWR